MQNNDFWTRIKSLYGSQTSPVVLYMQNSAIGTRITSPYGYQTLPIVLCTQNSAISTIKLVSMGPSPHLWYMNAKQRLLGQNNKSLCVPALICVFWMQNSDFCTRITSLYGSQISPVVLCMQNSVISFKSIWVPALICGFVHAKQRL